METLRIYFAFSVKGSQELIKLLKFEEFSSQNEQKEAIIFPPSILMGNGSLEEKVLRFFTWHNRNQSLQSEMIEEIEKNIIEKCVDVDETSSQIDIKFITDCIHQLSNEIPSTGKSVLEIYLSIGDTVYNKELHMDLYLSLKRLEIWNDALIMAIESENEGEDNNSLKSWSDLLDIETITLDKFYRHHKLKGLWGGTITLLMEKRSSHFPVTRSYLELAEKDNAGSSESKFFKNVLAKSLNTGICFSNNIEVVACVKQEDIPYHLVYPVKYTLHSLNDRNGFNFFKFCSKMEGYWLMAFLRYDFSKQTIPVSRTQEDWMEFVSDSFTHYLCIDYNSRLRHHCVMFLRYSDLNGRDTSWSNVLDVYFLRHPSYLNGNGFMKMLKTCDHQIDVNLPDRCPSEFSYTTSASDLIHPSDWCEKASWYLEETANNIGKSLARFKSDEFFMGGVPITSADTAKTESKNIFPNFIKMFDKNGTALVKNLQPIPVITDRLFKNLKTEENIKELDFKSAEKEIGHGIDYCLDSKSSLRLDGRLTKVQMRYVPDDRLNLACYIEVTDDGFDGAPKNNNTDQEPPSTSRACSGTKRALEQDSSQSPAESKTAKRRKGQPVKKETRKEKNMRRLRTLVDGAVTKYGGIDCADNKFLAYCQKLFEICVEELKKLTTSKNLNEQMRQLAKKNLHKVLPPG